MVGKINGFFGLLFLSLLSLTFLNSCDECYECDVYPDPYVNVKIVKASDLNLVNDSVANVVEQLAEARKVQAALTADAPVQEVNDIKAIIDSLNAEKVRLETKRNLLRTGMVKIDSLKGDYNRAVKIVSDSATTHRFPLSMKETSSSFEIYLKGHSNVETLTLHYKTELVVENNRVIIKANSIEDRKPPITTFDSLLIVERDDRKITDETTIYLYY